MFVKGRMLVSTLVPSPLLTRLVQALPQSLRFFARLSLVLQRQGGLWGRENVKIIIMQPQIKSPRFINTSSSVRKLGSALLRKCMNQIYFFGDFL